MNNSPTKEEKCYCQHPYNSHEWAPRYYISSGNFTEAYMGACSHCICRRFHIVPQSIPERVGCPPCKENSNGICDFCGKEPSLKNTDYETYNEGFEFGKKQGKEEVLEEIKKLIADEIAIAHTKDAGGKTSRLTSLYMKVCNLSHNQPKQ